jgi:hypothetical protein
MFFVDMSKSNMYFMLDATITFHKLCIGAIKSFNQIIVNIILKTNSNMDSSSCTNNFALVQAQTKIITNNEIM